MASRAIHNITVGAGVRPGAATGSLEYVLRRCGAGFRSRSPMILPQRRVAATLGGRGSPLV